MSFDTLDSFSDWLMQNYGEGFVTAAAATGTEYVAQPANQDAAPNENQIATGGDTGYGGGDTYSLPNDGSTTGYGGSLGTNASGGFDESAYAGLDHSKNPSLASTTAPTEKGLADRIDEFLTKSGIGPAIKNNPKLAELLAGAIGGMAKSQNQKEMLKNKYAFEAQSVADKRSANSASVTGLKPIPRGGLMGQELKRPTGAKVFSPGGLIAFGG